MVLDVVRLFKRQGNPSDVLGKTPRACFLSSWPARMWRKSHRIEQTREFKALITFPWVALGRRTGLICAASSEAGHVERTVAASLEFLLREIARGGISA